MEVRLSPDQSAFVRRCVQVGRFSTVEEVVTAALAMLDDRQDDRAAFRQAVKLGLEQVCVERGGYISGDDIRRRALRKERAA